MFDTSILATLPIWFVAFLFSTTCHEAAHALVGTKLGDPTAEDQVTLDPTPHMTREPVGMLLVPLLSFFAYHGQWMLGWASAPYDPRWASRYPKRAAFMSLAGPAANLTLAFLAFVAMRVCLARGVFVPHAGAFDSLVVAANGRANPVTIFASVMFSLNLLLGVFNLMPVPPLDGHGVVPLFLSPRAEYRWKRLFEGPGRMIGLVAAYLIFPRIFAPIYLAIVPLLYA